MDSITVRYYTDFLALKDEMYGPTLNTLLCTAFDFANNYLVHEWPEYDEPVFNFSVMCSLAWEDEWVIDF